MKMSIGALCTAVISFISLSSHAAFIGVLPATSGGTDWQAFYDDQLDVTWVANANINGTDNWDNQETWAAGLNIGGVTGWRLPSVGSSSPVVCTSSISQGACKANEFGHLFRYGAGTTYGGGITSSNPGPFSNVLGTYWSSTEVDFDPSQSWTYDLTSGNLIAQFKLFGFRAWAVHSGNVGPSQSAVPVPASVWLFGSGLLGLLGLANRKKV